MIKALPKAQVIQNFHGHFGHGINPPAVPWHHGDSAEVKTQQLSPAKLLLSQAS